MRNAEIPDSYALMNFNDLVMGFVTLFTLMVVNNWFIIVEMFEEVTGTFWSRFFFIFFYFFSVLVILNILVALSIDIYSSVESILESEKNNEDEDALAGDKDEYTRGSFAALAQSRTNKYKAPLLRKDSDPLTSSFKTRNGPIIHEAAKNSGYNNIQDANESKEEADETENSEED